MFLVYRAPETLKQKSLFCFHLLVSYVCFHLLEEVVGLTAEGTKGADYKGDYSHTVTGGGVPDWPK